MTRECFRHGKHGRWYTTRGEYLCGICQCESVRRAGAKRNYKRVLEAQGTLMADAYMSAVNAGLSVSVKPYLNGTAPIVDIPPLVANVPLRVGRGSGRALTVAKFARTDLDGVYICDRCLSPPPPNGILKVKMVVGPVNGGKKTRENSMILCPVCRSLTISAMKRDAPPVWTGKDWAWSRVMPQDVEYLWLYAAKWLTPEQRVQYAAGMLDGVLD